MKRFAGAALAAGLLVFAVTAAQAQISEPEVIVVAPSAEVPMPPPEMAARPAPPAYAPPLLPPREIRAIAREHGFEPIGSPRPHGVVYSIAVMNMAGDDGRLIVDGRNGRVRRFTPFYRSAGHYDDDAGVAYGDFAPPPGWRGAPRPPGRIPQVANAPQTVPLPKAAPHRVAAASANPVAAKPASQPAAPQAATVGVAKASEAKPAEAKAAAPVELKPAPQILPTQDMPAVQGLD